MSEIKETEEEEEKEFTIDEKKIFDEEVAKIVKDVMPDNYDYIPSFLVPDDENMNEQEFELAKALITGFEFKHVNAETIGIVKDFMPFDIMGDFESERDSF